MERNARGGVRYTEFLRSHFGVSPRDERLQRPEYVGGSKAPIIVSEVLQTSELEHRLRETWPVTEYLLRLHTVGSIELLNTVL